MFLRPLYRLHLLDRPAIISPTTHTYSSTVQQAGAALLSQHSKENVMASPMLAPMIKFRYTNNNGFALANGKVYTSVSGTNTPLETYADPNGDAFNTNPVILDARGEADIWLQPGKKYRFTIKDSNDALIDITDKIIGASPAAVDPGAISILAYGADPTGETDSSSAIQAAMVAASDVKSFIYVPAGTYKITGTLSNATAPECRGIVGDSATSSIIDASDGAFNAIVFNNPPVGMRCEHFRIKGPGQSAIGSATGLSFPVDGFGPLDISFQINMINVTAEQFPTAGFYWQLPIVSTYTNCVAQECGTYGFHIDSFTSEYVGGTSTQFNACYANNVLGSGYYIKSHGYSVLSSCAADNCNVAYYIKNGFGQSLIGCGCEVSTYVETSEPGHAVVLDGASGCTIDTLWTYNMPNAASRQVKLISCSGVTIRGVSGYQDNGVSPTHYASVDNATVNTVFINNVPMSSDVGALAPTFLVDDLGSKTITIGDGNGGITGINFDVPDIYGNSLYVRNGSAVISGDPGAGTLSLFQTLLYDYPVMSLANTGSISIGNGSGAADTFIQRAGVNKLTLSPILDGLSIVGNNTNPAIFTQNTGTIPGHWSIGADNDGGCAIYDQQHSQNIAYFWPKGGTAYISDGTMELYHGLRLAPSGRLYVIDGGNSASGHVVFPATTSVNVANALVTATSRILVTIQDLFSGAPAIVYVSSRTPGVGFTLTASAALDGRVAYLITEP
jgi:hypothetical protein